MLTLALAGDTMLGRGVADHLAVHPVSSLFGADLLGLLADTDGVLLNLECCISSRGEPWPRRVFHFRAPPRAVDALTLLGVRCVTLANNHALDFGPEALLDTLHLLAQAGVAVAGAGVDEAAARQPCCFTVAGQAVTVLSVTDHPGEYTASHGRPGVAFADLGSGVPAWLTQRLRAAVDGGGPVVVSPHWGPNMTTEPPAHVRASAEVFVREGASLVAGHSAHVFHGAAAPVLFDLGDFLDDYAVDPRRRNDLGVVWLVTFDGVRLVAAEAVPLRLRFAHTDLASGEDADWVRDRLRRACAALGSEVRDVGRGMQLVLA